MIIKNWVAYDLPTHLEQLAAAAAKWRDGKGDRPIVTLHLASGQRHTGFVLEVVLHTVSLQSLPQRGTADLDVTVIPISRIEALTLHAAQALIEPPVPETAASMLDLRRRAKALADHLATDLGRPIAVEVGAGDLAELAPLFEHLRIALERVCADQLGRTSLVERVKSIVLHAGPAGIALANGVLSASGPLRGDDVQTRLDALL